MPQNVRPVPADRLSAVVVDAYASGRFLTRAFAGLGCDVVHVQSTERLIDGLMAPALGDYRRTVVCAAAEDRDAVVSGLADCRTVAVAAGSEVGVPLADVLADRLGLPGNGTALTSARRDKFTMIETLREAGLRGAEQSLVSRPEQAVAWAETAGYPVVVKPLSSSSTDHVFICRDSGQTAAAAASVLGSANLFGEPNHRALIQSYLEGTEYAIDTVSANGCRYVCGVWEYRKHTSESGRRTYDRNVLLAPEAAPVPALIAYVDRVLAALGIANGPAHAEVIMTASGPALVEIAARLNGGMDPSFHDLCLGANQADVTALAYVRPERFAELYANRVYRKLTDAVVHHTTTAHDGVVEAVDHELVGQIEALPTVYSVGVKLTPGRRIRPTVDLFTSPLRISLASQDPARLLADYEAIQELRELVYRVRPV